MPRAVGSSRARVVHMTTVHPPTDVRIQKQCRTLAEAGYDVTLLAACDAIPAVSAVHVVRIPKAPARARRMLLSTATAYRAARALHADVYHFHDPELMPVGAALRRHGAAVVYDVHENYPAEILTKPWIAPPLRRLVSRVTDAVERRLCERFDLIVAATPSIATRFPSERTIVVQNFPELDEPLGGETLRMDARPVQVAYVGDLTVVRCVLEMVKAVNLAPAGVELHIAGRMSPPSIEESMRALDVGHRVRFLGYRSRAEVHDLLSLSRAGLVLFHPTPNHVSAQPNKLFEYMAAGIPVIASDFPLWRKIVLDSGCGLVVDPTDPSAIAAAITSVIEDPERAEQMGRRGVEAVHRRFNWSREAASLVEGYRRLLAARGLRGDRAEMALVRPGTSAGAS